MKFSLQMHQETNRQVDLQRKRAGRDEVLHRPRRRAARRADRVVRCLSALKVVCRQAFSPQQDSGEGFGARCHLGRPDDFLVVGRDGSLEHFVVGRSRGVLAICCPPLAQVVRRSLAERDAHSQLSKLA